MIKITTMLFTLPVAFAFFSSSVNAIGQEQIYKGVYSAGPEVEVFSVCGMDKTYWTSYNWAGIPLTEFYAQKATEPYQGVYVEFRGHLLNEELNFFASQYDGLIHISEIKKMAVEIPAECGTTPE